MANTKNLILPDSFEAIKGELGKDLDKMMEFFVPITETEQDISLIATSIKNTGKLVLMHGVPGIGKSTFIQSLKWRNHIPIREIFNINASEFNPEISKLPQLLGNIKKLSNENDIKPTKNGVVLLVIDYLESLEDETPKNKKSFFRDLNGILRNTPIMIIWPVTEKIDIEDIIGYTKTVSGTIFYRGKEVLYFQGPPREKFPSILKNTIAVLNAGYTFNDYQLVESDFDELLSKLSNSNNEFTLRDYIFEVRNLWHKRTEKIKQILDTIPKPTEIWFVFSMPEAESLVTQFVRKSKNIEDCWDAYHSKLDEYIHSNQKSAFWNSNRLQLALSGSFKTKIFYLPTNTLVSLLAAYGDEFKVNEKIDWSATGISETWKTKSTAKRFLKTAPLIRQINGEHTIFGATRSGRAKKSIENARQAFSQINALASKYNPQRDGSDKPFNKTIAKAISKVIPTNIQVRAETPHPWLPHIIPDITVEEKDKLICIEFCFTKKSVPSAIADYVLNKLDNYMRQIESMHPNIY